MLTAKIRYLASRHRPLIGSLLAGCASQLALVLGGVLAARSLGAQDRGYFALIVLIPHIISQLGNLGLPLAATYYIARDRLAVRPIVGELTVPVAGQLILGGIIQAAVLAIIFQNDPVLVRTAAVVSLGILPGMLALQYGLAILQGQQRFRAFNVLRTLPTVVWAFGVLIVFTLTSHTLIEVVAVQTGSLLLVGGASLGIALLNLPRLDNRSAAPSRGRLFRFGVRGLLGYISPIESFRLDQAVIGLFLTPTALGLYVVGVSLTNLPRFLAQSVGLVAYPRVASASSRTEARRLSWRYFWLALGISLAVVIPLELSAAALIPFFFGDDFSGATSVARILLLGTVILGARRVLADAARGMGHPGVGTVAEMGSWLALLPALAFLLPAFGLNGVALALVVSWCFSFAILLVALVLVRSPGGRPGHSATPLTDPTEQLSR
jgi:O-antigen/teichoic acid export membrane protein